MDKLISVILPVYNEKRFLTQALISVCEQTYLHLEIILVDNGSTDGSSALCDELATRDSRIKVIHKEHGGLSSARNAGLDVCTGDYICFLDSDDYMEPVCIERLAANMEHGDYDFVGCLYDHVDEEGRFISVLKYENREFVFEDGDVLRYIGSKNYRACAWAKLYKRCVFDDIRYKDGMVFEDNDMLVRILKQCRAIKIIPEVLVHYRRWRDTMTIRYMYGYDPQILDIFESYRICAEEVKGTQWEKFYYNRIWQYWRNCWYYSRFYKPSEKSEMRERLLEIVSSDARYIDYSVYTLKEKLKITLRYIQYRLLK